MTVVTGLKKPQTIVEGSTSTTYFPINFRPQQQHVLENLSRFSVIMAHRRWGKTVLLLVHLILSALTLKKRNPVFWYVAPFQKQAKEVAWQYLKDFMSPLPQVKISETELSISIDLGDGYGKRTIRLVGVDDGAESGRGVYLDGVVLDEMGQIKRGVWESVIRPALSDRKGWAVLTGTPAVGYWQEMFQFAKGSDEWKVFDYSDARSTKIIDGDELISLEKSSDDLPKFRREYYGEWITGDIGSYYLENLSRLQDAGKISDQVIYNPKLPVVASWDLGLNDKTVVWFAQYDPSQDKLALIDYWEKRGVVDYRHALSDVEQLGYKIDLMVIPHDSSKRTGTGDDTVKKVFENKYRVLRIPKTGNKLTDITIVKNYFNNLLFNSEKCHKGIVALYNYRSALNKKTDQLSLVPMHCDASDSFRYMIMGLFRAKYLYSQKADSTPKVSFIQTNSYDPI